MYRGKQSNRLQQFLSDENHQQSRYSHEADEDYILNESKDGYKQEDEKYDYGIEKDFIKVNSASVDFSYNISQNSGFLSSHRHQDDSQDEKLDNEHILEYKRKEEIQFNAALDRQLKTYRRELETKQLQMQKLRTLNKGYQIKIKNKDSSIQQLQNQVDDLQNAIAVINAEKEELYNKINTKDSLFTELMVKYKAEIDGMTTQIMQKHELQKEVQFLKAEISQLKELLSNYSEPDRRLYDFKGSYPTLSKRTSQSSDDSQKLKKMKANYDTQLLSMKKLFEEKQNKLKLSEEQLKKRMSMKEKKFMELQTKVNELKQENIKLKAQNEQNIDKLNSLNASKMKEAAAFNQKIVEYEKRIKSILQEGKKKDQKMKDVNIDLIEKLKHVNSLQKAKADLTQKLQFDHLMIQEKTSQIERLLQQRRALKQQIDSTDRSSEKTDRNDKMQKEKTRKELDKYKKEVEQSRKQIDNLKRQIDLLTKQKQEHTTQLKQNKRKVDELIKRNNQLKAENEEKGHHGEQQAKQREMMQHVSRELNEYKKRAESIPQLKNKIILLETRLKSQSMYKENSAQFDEEEYQDRIQSLQLKLEQKQRELKQLKSYSNSNKDIQLLEQDIQERDDLIQHLEEKILEYKTLMSKLKEQIVFKDRTLEFTHEKLISYQKNKIEAEQENKILLQKLMKYEEYNEDFEKNLDLQNLLREYEDRFEQVQDFQVSFKKKEEEYIHQIKNLKEKVRQLKMMLHAPSQRKIQPENMSPQDTVNFLIKTIKRVNGSRETLNNLSQSGEIRDFLFNMERYCKK